MTPQPLLRQSSKALCRACGEPRDLRFALMCDRCIRTGVPIPPLGDGHGDATPRRLSKRCGCSDCNPGGGYECLNTEMCDERDRYRDALEMIASRSPFGTSSEAAVIALAREALDG